MADYYFQLPRLDQLTRSQQATLQNIGPIALCGGPGTGKSVVSLYRHLIKTQGGSRTLLLTYTTTLKFYLSSCLRSVAQNASNSSDRTKANAAASSVGSTLRTTWNWNVQNHNPHYDEIIVDEAQDIEQDRYKIIKAHAGDVSFGADDAQSLYPEQGCTFSELMSVFPSNTKCLLGKNFRNTKCILDLARDAFPNANISFQDVNSCNIIGNKPILFITDDQKYTGIANKPKQDEVVLNLLSELESSGNQNIAILCPWQKDVEHFRMLIKERFPNSTYYYRQGNVDHGCEEISSLHVTTFKSAKGLEFDSVIIPSFDRAFGNFDPQFHVSWRDYYVGVTRAKTNLYLISCEYLSCISSDVEINRQ